MNFCSNCGKSVTLRIPEGDNRLRYCCSACDVIHYQNPRLVVGTIPMWNNQVLLCRRAIEPRHGYWTLPAGFMENEETVAAGAERETTEEAGARIVLGPMFSMIDVVHVHQVHVFFRARLLDTEFDPGPESLEVQLFHEAEIPWNDLAFRTVSLTLQRHFEQLRLYGDTHFELYTDVVTHLPRPTPPESSVGTSRSNSIPHIASS